MALRRATHADSWYNGNRATLDGELTNWLNAVATTQTSKEVEGFSPPVKGCKAVIAPHAGYSYSGPAAAWAYKSIDTTGIKRVFILGPSHHVYLNGCALSRCKNYETPIGSLPLDLDTITELRQTGKFSDMNIETDEDEHSIEMHLPYVRKVFEGIDIKVVPILVGAINKEKEAFFGRLLAPYLAREDTFCVVSSDFCHWGTRFSYTHYYKSKPPAEVLTLARASVSPSDLRSFPIWQSIEALDREGMSVLANNQQSAAEVHTAFSEYLSRTKNTICGRHPIGVLFGALTAVEEGEEGKKASVTWVRYEQSSQCQTIRDSSVSYASAYVVF